MAGPSQAATNCAAPLGATAHGYTTGRPSRERSSAGRPRPEASVHAHGVDARHLAHLERADHEPADGQDVDRGGAPCLAERVEPILQEGRRRVEAAGAETLDDLLVQERVHVAVCAGRPIRVAVPQRVLRAGELRKLIEAVDGAGGVRPFGHEGRGHEDRHADEHCRAGHCEGRIICLWYNRPVRLLVLDRYILRELVSPSCSAACCSPSFVIAWIYSPTDLVITKGVPFHLVVQLFVFMLPSFMAMTLPLGLLRWLAGGRLASDLEIVAFRAAGVSALRLFRPVLLASLIVALITAGLTLVLNPMASREFQRQLFRILQAKAASGLQERVFLDVRGPDGLRRGRQRLPWPRCAGSWCPTSAIRSSRGSSRRAKARLLTDEANQRITLSLLDGAVNEVDVVPIGAPTAVGAAQPRTSGPPRYRYTRFDVYDMSLSTSSPLMGAPKIEKPEKDDTLRELNRKIAEERTGTRAFLIERHKRFALPLAALVFGLIAFRWRSAPTAAGAASRSSAAW